MLICLSKIKKKRKKKNEKRSTWARELFKLKDIENIKPRQKKKKNEESDLGVGFNDTFKTDNPILSIVSRANAMIVSWVV